MKMFSRVIFVALLACTTAREAEKNNPPVVETKSEPTRQAAPKWNYPPSRRENIEEIVQGERIADPYRWLEDEKSPEVKTWMAQQDGLTREVISKISYRETLAKRLKEILYVDSVGIPQRRGNRFFYTRTHASKEKAIVYWREGEQGQEKMLLDPNAWSLSGEVSLGTWSPSWDGTKVAFNQRPYANDEAVMHVIDVKTGKWSDVDVIEGTKYGGASWTPDNRSFYYTWVPTDSSISPADRPGYQEVRLHRLGTDPKTDRVICPKTGDPRVFQGVNITRDGKYLFLNRSRIATENEIWIKPARLDREFTLLAKGENTKYAVDYWRDQIYLTTDENAPRKHVFKVPANHPQRKNWKEIIPEESGTLQDVSVIGGQLALHYLKNASSELWWASLDGKRIRPIDLPGIGSTTDVSGQEDLEDAYFEFSSMTLPRQIYKTSAKTGRTSLWAKVDLPIDPSRFLTEQVWYPSKDGTPVSMFLVRSKDLRKDGSNPVLLNGYGGFNLSSLPSFRAYIYPWLEAGGVFALANLRGGGEYGESWHDAGRLHNKQNVFDDFIAAAEYLVRERYTVPAKLAIFGGSNGGLLVGAAMTQRPELFGAVVCEAPLLDMVRYHLYGGGKTWIPEYGDPAKPEDLKVLRAYSPYHQVQPGAKYPMLLMMSPASDDRVHTMHARKFVAAIQAANASDAPSLLRIETNAGHQGGGLVKKRVETYTDMYSILFQRFEMRPGPGPSPFADAR